VEFCGILQKLKNDQRLVQLLVQRCNYITKCDEKIQTELPKTVGPTDSYLIRAKSYEANTTQLQILHF